MDFTELTYLSRPKVVYRGGIRAAIDTGSTFTFLPLSVAKAIYAAVPNSKAGLYVPSLGAQYYNFPCDSPASVGFTFRGSTNKFHQTAAALIAGEADPSAGAGRCVGSVVGVDINDSTGMPISVIGGEHLLLLLPPISSPPCSAQIPPSELSKNERR